MRLAGVVFDLFHTLVVPEAHAPVDHDPLRSVAALAGIDEATLRSWWAAWAMERETTTIDLVDLVERVVGSKLTAERRSEIDAVFGIGKDDALRTPDREVVSLVSLLGRTSDVPPSVLSNCHEREVRAWSESPLASLIGLFGRSSRIGAMKPNPVAYRWLTTRLGVASSDLAYVGNGSSDELVGARAAGFGLVVHFDAVDRRFGLVDDAECRRRSSQADCVAPSLDELSQLLTAVLS